MHGYVVVSQVELIKHGYILSQVELIKRDYVVSQIELIRLDYVVVSQVELIRRDYVANGGWETFLSYEDPEQDILVGLLRLRKCSQDSFRPELKGGCSIVRELHVYGSVVPVHARDPTKFQHQGFGMLLMEEAERIARDEHGSSKVAVISGVACRGFICQILNYFDTCNQNSFKR